MPQLTAEERSAYEGAAAIIAKALLELDLVRGVHLVDHGPQLADQPQTDGPPHPSDIHYRILVVVDDELAVAYLTRLKEPLVISYQDGDDNGHAWWDERSERPEELPWHLLETTKERFFDYLCVGADYEEEALLREIENGGEVEFVLVPANWPGRIEELTGFTVEHQHDETPIVTTPFPEIEWRYAAYAYRVFDSQDGRFLVTVR
jgi:hypothetical protein